MENKQRRELFRTVFDPQEGEQVLFLLDTPHGDLKDTEAWAARREGMYKDWYLAFQEMSARSKLYLSISTRDYKATGRNNAQIPQGIIEEAKKSNLVIAMTQYSATGPLMGGVCNIKGTTTRCASMPGVIREMEDTALSADYALVKKRALAIKKMLDKAVGAEVVFSTEDNDKLYIDLRNRVAEADTGECTKAGQLINLPSGEGFKPPYEAAPDEIGEFGRSKTQGVLPVSYDGEVVRYTVNNNGIGGVFRDTGKAAEMLSFFKENPLRGNIAELGIGCNPKAIVRGIILEDEKVGLHIANGNSDYFGGKVGEAGMHEDHVFAKGCPIEGKTLTLINPDDSRIELICNAELQLNLLG